MSIYADFLNMQNVLPDENLYETRLENDSEGRTLYIGICITPNGDPAAKIWYIKKIYYDGNGFINRVQLPDGGTFFMYAWDDRATYFS